jgi:tRNA (guanine-N7-)-methyltransferase
MKVRKNKNNNNNMDAPNSKKRSAGPITADGEMPQKKFYRQRAHCNPLAHNNSFQYPLSLADTSWLQDHYPNLPEGQRHPTVLDCGCGFGGLTVALAKLLPHEVIMGLEIRAKVTEYVRLRIVALRQEHPGQYEACSVMRTNSMKFLPHFFPKASLNKLFFCFPDPNFKRKNHGRRIVSERLLSEYAYLLKPKIGRLYCITDVKELAEWHETKCDQHPLFRRLSEEECNEDPCVEAMKNETEEGKKVSRSGGDNKKGEKYYCVYERIPDEDMEPVTSENFFGPVVEEEKEEEEGKEKE